MTIIKKNDLDKLAIKLIRDKLKKHIFLACGEFPTDKNIITKVISSQLQKSIIDDLVNYYKCFITQGDIFILEITAEEYADILLGK